MASLGPIVAVERTVVDGFADVCGIDVFTSGKIGDGAGDFQDAVVGACGKALAVHRFFEQRFAFGVERAVLANLCRRHCRI